MLIWGPPFSVKMRQTRDFVLFVAVEGYQLGFLMRFACYRSLVHVFDIDMPMPPISPCEELGHFNVFPIFFLPLAQIFMPQE